MTSPRCTGVVLAGGASSRFDGALKGLLPLGGRRVLDRVLDALGAVADEVVVIANDARIRDAVRGTVVHEDVRPERGSVVGLHSALSHATDSALVVAWDMPFVSPALLGELRMVGEREDAAVVPEGPRGPEPLCAYYPSSCIEVVERQLASGEFRLGALVSLLPNCTVLSLEHVARFGNPDRLFANINIPADLDVASRWLDESASCFAQDPLTHSGIRG